MKTKKLILERGKLILPVILGMFLLTGTLFAQKEEKPKDSKKMKVYIKSDKDGKSKVIDTTIDISGSKDHSAIEEAMKEYEIELSDAEEGLHSMVLQLSDIDLNDSSGMDSLKQIVKKIKKIRIKSGKPHCIDYYSDYFDVPGWPDVPPPPPPPPPDGDISLFEGFDEPGPFMRSFRGEGNTLNDVIGDIPMDRVLNYSIKDTKKGKKITIEISDFPQIERPPQVIIIKEPRKGDRMDWKRRPKVKKRIIWDEGKQELKEKSERG